jgi:hypothetical protein
MPVGAQFVVAFACLLNLHVLSEVAVVSCASPSLNYCVLDSVASGNPAAKLLVTQRWEGVYNPHSIGVYYAGGSWRVFHQDGAAMPVGAMFNVAIVNPVLHDGFEALGDLSGWAAAVPLAAVTPGPALRSPR